MKKDIEKEKRKETETEIVNESEREGTQRGSGKERVQGLPPDTKYSHKSAL